MAQKTKQQTDIAIYSKQLEDGIAAIRETDSYKRFLNCMSVFHGYSFSNTIMIMMQCPEATQVAGFAGWKKLGRFVRKGEKGIRIWAPRMVKKEEQDTEETQEAGAFHLTGFRLVSVFDISQTDGEPLPSVTDFTAQTLEGSPEDFEAVTSAIASVAKFPVRVAPLEGGVRGYCSHDDREIVISDTVEGNMFVSVLAHEAAHSILHGPSCELTRDAKEVEAESVSYIVCRHFGIDSDPKSFGYVASWASEMSDNEYKERIKAIQHTASDMISQIHNAMAEGKKAA